MPVIFRTEGFEISKVPGEDLFRIWVQEPAPIWRGRGNHNRKSAVLDLPRSIFPELLQALLKIEPVKELRGSKPLVLYFKDDKDRAEFEELVRAAKPGMRTVKL